MTCGTRLPRDQYSFRKRMILRKRLKDDLSIRSSTSTIAESINGALGIGLATIAEKTTAKDLRLVATVKETETIDKVLDHACFGSKPNTWRGLAYTLSSRLCRVSTSSESFFVVSVTNRNIRLNMK